MSEIAANTVQINPESWGGYCPVHYQPLPCGACSTSIPTPGIYPNVVPDVSPPPAPLVPGATMPLFGYRFLPDHCEHCWCEDNDNPEHGGLVAHVGCCNCGARKVK